jgi:predicted TIM-barrel fold metal-dependent hydrolase
VPWLERKPSEVAREHVRFSTQPLEHTEGDDELLFAMLEAAGAPDNLVFASDYPHWDFDDPFRAFPAGVPAEGKRQILAGNGRAVYRLG